MYFVGRGHPNCCNMAPRNDQNNVGSPFVMKYTCPAAGWCEDFNPLAAKMWAYTILSMYVKSVMLCPSPIICVILPARALWIICEIKWVSLGPNMQCGRRAVVNNVYWSSIHLLLLAINTFSSAKCLEYEYAFKWFFLATYFIDSSPFWQSEPSSTTQDDEV